MGRVVKSLMSDKRQFPRVSLQTELWIGQDGIFTKSRGTLRDLSEGGAFIETSEGFQIGSVLQVRFRVPGARELVSCAVAVRHRRGGDGVGVQFLDLTTDSRQVVSDFVSSGEREILPEF